MVLANSEEAKNFANQVAIKAMELALQAKYGIPLPPTEAPAKINAVALPSPTLESHTGNYVVFGQATQLTRGKQRGRCRAGNQEK